MRTRLLSEAGGRRVFAVVFDKGDEVTEGLTRFAAERRLGASQVTAIGAFSSATLGYFDRGAKEYLKIPVREQVEVLSLLGDIVDDAGRPTLHAHAVVGRRDGTTLGGHLLDGHVWPTLEVIVTETPAHLRKRHDAETGLALISIPEPAPPTDAASPPADVADDEVAEASWESFPASDPPGWRDHEPHGPHAGRRLRPRGRVLGPPRGPRGPMSWPRLACGREVWCRPPVVRHQNLA